jgi:hemerythrin
MGLDWREQLSVGNDLLDTDHKHLISVINQAELSLKSKNMAGLTTVLESLSSYAKIHFAREELVATAVGYPDVAQIHESHEALIVRLAQVKQEMGDAMTDESSEHFGVFLRDWLVSHVIKEDMKMKPYLTKHSPRFDPRR